MKKVKFLVITAVLALAFICVNTTSADKFDLKKQGVKITFEKALQIPGLFISMTEQLDVSMLEDDLQVYVGVVAHEDEVYLIVGTLEQWEWFFSTNWKKKFEPNNNKFGTG